MRQTGIFRRLQYRRVTRRQRTTKGTAKHLRRIIPRQHMARHAERLAQGHDRKPIQKWNRCAVQFVASPRVIFEITRAGRDVGARLRERLAGIARFDLRQFFVMIQYFLAEFMQQAAALKCRHLAPRALECGARGGDGTIDIGRRAARDLREHFAGARIDDGYRLARCGRFPTIVDEYFSCSHYFHSSFRFRLINCTQWSTSNRLTAAAEKRGAVRLLARPTACAFFHGAVAKKSSPFLPTLPPRPPRRSATYPR